MAGDHLRTGVHTMDLTVLRHKELDGDWDPCGVGVVGGGAPHARHVRLHRFDPPPKRSPRWPSGSSTPTDTANRESAGYHPTWPKKLAILRVLFPDATSRLWRLPAFPTALKCAQPRRKNAVDKQIHKRDRLLNHAGAQATSVKPESGSNRKSPSHLHLPHYSEWKPYTERQTAAGQPPIPCLPGHCGPRLIYCHQNNPLLPSPEPSLLPPTVLLPLHSRIPTDDS